RSASSRRTPAAATAATAAANATPAGSISARNAAYINATSPPGAATSPPRRPPPDGEPGDGRPAATRHPPRPTPPGRSSPAPTARTRPPLQLATSARRSRLAPDLVGPVDLAQQVTQPVGPVGLLLHQLLSQRTHQRLRVRHQPAQRRHRPVQVLVRVALAAVVGVDVAGRGLQDRPHVHDRLLVLRCHRDTSRMYSQRWPGSAS